MNEEQEKLSNFFRNIVDDIISVQPMSDSFGSFIKLLEDNPNCVVVFKKQDEHKPNP